MKKNDFFVGESVLVTRDSFPSNIGRIGTIVSVSLDEPFAFYIRFENGMTDVVMDVVHLTPLLRALL
jgi:hypothetical protein